MTENLCDKRKEGDFDLFDNPMVRAASAAMSEKDKENYRKIGEELYNTVDFPSASILNNMEPPFKEASVYISVQLRSGLHPSYLSEDEKEVMKQVYGDTWYKQWNYEEQDLSEIFTLQK